MSFNVGGERMDQLTKDCLILALVGMGSGVKLKDIIDDYDEENVHELALSVIGKNDEEVETKIVTLLNESYDRIKKKFPKQ